MNLAVSLLFGWSAILIAIAKEIDPAIILIIILLISSFELFVND